MVGFIFGVIFGFIMGAVCGMFMLSILTMNKMKEDEKDFKTE